jgi:hypothetical protein
MLWLEYCAVYVYAIEIIKERGKKREIDIIER